MPGGHEQGTETSRGRFIRNYTNFCIWPRGPSVPGIPDFILGIRASREQSRDAGDWTPGVPEPLGHTLCYGSCEDGRGSMDMDRIYKNIYTSQSTLLHVLLHPVRFMIVMSFRFTQIWAGRKNPGGGGCSPRAPGAEGQPAFEPFV